MSSSVFFIKYFFFPQLVCVWNVETGMVDAKVPSATNGSEDCPTSVCFSPDGSRIVCGGNRGQFFTCDSKGELKDTWEGIRVQSLHYRADSKHILAADTHHRIRSYNFEDLSDVSILQEEHGIMSFSVDKLDKYALLNIAGQGLHLWDIDSRCLIKKYTGITQGFYTLYSCFGGVNESFIASGSEDNKVYIYHREHEKPVQVLSGHSRVVNCVSWNPVYTNVLVSASDDNTLRVWGPASQFRRRQSATSSGAGVPAAGGSRRGSRHQSNGNGAAAAAGPSAIELSLIHI